MVVVALLIKTTSHYLFSLDTPWGIIKSSIFVGQPMSAQTQVGVYQRFNNEHSRKEA